jgi:cysteine desulfuration protein SufE
MTTPAERAEEIREAASWLDDWEARYAWLIDLGKAHPALQPHERSEENRVRGCASQVWMVTSSDDGRLHLRAESDAILVTGLIALLTQLFDLARPEDILAFDTTSFLNELGITGALTAQRSNGLASMLARIRSDASRLMTPMRED